MKLELDSQKIVIFSGAGLSADSGLPTFRDHNGLWQNHNVLKLASAEMFKNNPELVHQFYNERRKLAANAMANVAHLAIAELEHYYQVVVITQNVDELHEQAGSTQVIHLHGKLSEARSSLDPSLTYPIGDEPLSASDVAEDGSLLRPNIVWFGESVPNLTQAKQHMRSAGKVLVVGTSLAVEPAASILKHARLGAEKYMINLDIVSKPYGFRFLRGSAIDCVPDLVNRWLKSANEA
ncbi:Sir2 family NAD-dependent protein deacetylase [Oceanisphaera sp. W20_SRM_FM3]|uniref:Sir2 family NAD-dependent protein deacetylase n=1 Tax=Oceanisphaera sp. W20_SRM_FM3 TaxID=3240267 RepID=UPI003F9A4FF6